MSRAPSQPPIPSARTVPAGASYAPPPRATSGVAFRYSPMPLLRAVVGTFFHMLPLMLPLLLAFGLMWGMAIGLSP